MPEIKPHKNQSDSLKLPLHRENKVVVYHKLTICAYVFLVLHTTNSQDGPMVVGLAPQDASDRLIMFQVQYPVIYKMLCNMFCWCTYKWFIAWSYLPKWSGAPQNRFDNLFRKYITYTGGEDLFGLPVTQHPQLLEIRKQLTLLQKLYGLYNSVIDTVNGYYDISWADINIDRINNELLEFQSRWEGYRSQTKFLNIHFLAVI